MKRVSISLEALADRNNLILALHKAAKGKHHHPEVALFLQAVDSRLNQLAMDIRAAKMPYGRYRSFQILDPKKRLIHAACFEDRVFHHAVMNLAGAVLERAMLPVSFACRPAKGVHKSVKIVQQHLRKFPFYCKIDIAGYFASIDHALLLSVLMQRFKGDEFKQQLQRIINSHQPETGKGIPIGSLTSQHFANYYLDGLDRFLNADARVLAQVRYMDDIVWWCKDRHTTRQVLLDVRSYLSEMRQLLIKPTLQIQASQQGISYCGFRISPATIRLSRRRKRSYQNRRKYWEQLYRNGLINGKQLQTSYAAVHAITQGADSLGWRQENLRRHPALTV